VSEDAIDAQAQYLGIGIIESAPGRPKGGQLGASPACEIEDVKGQKHILVASILAQGDLVALGGLKSKVWGLLPYLDLVCHTNFSLH
jgi:hypothetical protein